MLLDFEQDLVIEVYRLKLPISSKNTNFQVFDEEFTFFFLSKEKDVSMYILINLDI